MQGKSVITSKSGEPFTASIDVVDETLVVTLAGALDGYAETAVTELISEGAEFPNLVAMHFDLTGVSFIDSSGLRSLILARQGAEERSLAFTLLTPPSGFIERLLEICGLTQWFGVA